MKSGINEVLTLVQDSLEENISRENFNKTLQFLIENDSAISNSVSNRYVSPYRNIILVETLSI